MLNLLAFANGAPAGRQGIGATRFARERVAETSSWLGAAYQGRALGTRPVVYHDLHLERDGWRCRSR